MRNRSETEAELMRGWYEVNREPVLFRVFRLHRILAGQLPDGFMRAILTETARVRSMSDDELVGESAKRMLTPPFQVRESLKAYWWR